MTAIIKALETALDAATIAREFDVEETCILVFNDDGTVTLENMDKSAVSLLQGAELTRFCWITADMERDRGRYTETVFLERSPDIQDNGIGAVAVGVYSRNTDLDGAFDTAEADFDGYLFLTDADNHAEVLNTANVRFEEITASKLMGEIGPMLGTLSDYIGALQHSSFETEPVTKHKTDFIEKWKSLNRTMALSMAQGFNGEQTS